MRRLTKIAAVTAVMALAVTGCAKKNTETNTASGGGDKGGLCASGGKGPKIGLAYDIGGRGDKSFNDLAAAGTKKASEELDATCKESEAAPDEPAASSTPRWSPRSPRTTPT